MVNIPIPLDSKAAFDCLGRLETRSYEEKRELVYLNDKFIDLIENVHFLEAENQALLHDRNLLKTGIEGDSSGINHIFETEMTNIQITIEEKHRTREHFQNEATILETQVNDAHDRLRSINSSNFGIPSEIDEEFRRLAEIQAENGLYLQRIRYMEEKNKKRRDGFGGIHDTINLMRLRKDQAESMKHEYTNRRNDLINSIHNMEAENKSIIMNEHKYFVKDRNVDRNTFRSEFRLEIDSIRQNYETLCIRSKEEINIRLQQRIRDLQTQGPDYKNILVSELRQVRESIRVIQTQVSDTELKNTLLQNMLDNLRGEAAENNKYFEISLSEKDAETERLKTQCTQMALEMEKLCEHQINLTAEIAKYRQLLDGFGNLSPPTNPPRPPAAPQQQQQPRIYDLPSDTTTQQTVIHDAHILEQPAPYTPLPVPLQKTYHSRQSLIDRQLSLSPIPSSENRSTSYFAPRTVYNPYLQPRQRSTPPPVITNERFSKEQTIAVSELVLTRTSTPVRDLYSPYRETSSAPQQPLPSYLQTRQQSTPSPVTRYWRSTDQHNVVTTAPAPEPYKQHHHHHEEHKHLPHQHQEHHHYPHHQQEHENRHQQHKENHPHQDQHREYDNHHERHSTVDNTHVQDHFSPTPRHENVGLTLTKDEESIDLDNVQRFTRWYKGRVKISDVTPDFVILENRSARKRANIGGFKLIHQSGHKSVFLDFPTHLILEPKDSLKIYARHSVHPHGSLVVEIDEFDTTTLSDTSLRNQSDEVKTWFKYVTNTERDHQV